MFYMGYICLEVIKYPINVTESEEKTEKIFLDLLFCKDPKILKISIEILYHLYRIQLSTL